MSAKEHVLALMKQRENLEQQIDFTREQLQSHKVGPSEPLVGADGFPRHDIDVATVRNLRVQLIRQENDMKLLLEEIRKGLANAFPKSSQPKETKSKQSNETDRAPFCEVYSVLSNSISDIAGIESGDRIISFGGSRSLSELPLIVQSHIKSQKPLEILITRKGESKLVSLDLSKGNSLGCHIVPI